jgi:hypothetical protein
VRLDRPQCAISGEVGQRADEVTDMLVGVSRGDLDPEPDLVLGHAGVRRQGHEEPAAVGNGRKASSDEYALEKPPTSTTLS